MAQDSSLTELLVKDSRLVCKQFDDLGPCSPPGSTSEVKGLISDIAAKFAASSIDFPFALACVCFRKPWDIVAIHVYTIEIR